MPYSCYKISATEKNFLRHKIPPRYSKTFIDHVTEEYFGNVVNNDTLALPPERNKFEIIGVADDGRGLQAAIVRIDDNLIRPDGGIYHITWSLNPEKKVPKEFWTSDQKASTYKPVHSNTLIKALVSSEGKPLKPENPDWQVTFFDKPVTFHPERENVKTASDLTLMKKRGIEISN